MGDYNLHFTFLHRSPRDADLGFSVAYETLKAAGQTRGDVRKSDRRPLAFVYFDFPDGRGFGYQLSLDSDKMIVSIGETGDWFHQVFTRSPEKDRNEQYFREWFVKLSRASNPYASYLDIEMYAGSESSISKVLKGDRKQFDPSVATIGKFNMMNFFSSEFVTRFGRDRLGMARHRAWLFEEFDDGSVLVVPQSICERPDPTLHGPDYLLSHLVP